MTMSMMFTVHVLCTCMCAFKASKASKCACFEMAPLVVQLMCYHKLNHCHLK